MHTPKLLSSDRDSFVFYINDKMSFPSKYNANIYYYLSNSAWDKLLHCNLFTEICGIGYNYYYKYYHERIYTLKPITSTPIPYPPHTPYTVIISFQITSKNKLSGYIIVYNNIYGIMNYCISLMQYRTASHHQVTYPCNTNPRVLTNTNLPVDIRYYRRHSHWLAPPLWILTWSWTYM